MKNHFTKKTMLERISGWGIILLLSGILFNFQPILAASEVEMQDGKKDVSGTVTDGSTGEALPGVTVMVKGTKEGAITNVEGKYSIKVTDSDVLIFKYLGFIESSMPVGSQTEININLDAEVIGMDEVVVVGFGVQPKKLVTGATVQLKNDDFIKNNVTRMESSLQGLTPGMVIVKQSGQPGSDYNISIRGLASPNGSSPLVLIDGVPGNINTINPSDVETVDILKDAASAAIYGSRAADGVILITTKKGKAGKQQVTYNGSFGISNPTKKIEVLNAKQYAGIMNEIFDNTNTKPNRQRPFRQGYIDSLGDGSDWQGEVINKNAPSQNHYLGVSGGNEKSTYSFSMSYSKEEGIYNFENKSNFERFGFHLSSDHIMNKYLKVGQNLTYNHKYTRGLGVTSIYNNFMRGLIQASPLIDIYDTSTFDGFGRSSGPLVKNGIAPSTDQINPIASMHYDYNDHKKNDDFFGNVYAEIEILKGLKFKSDFGANLGLSYNSNATDSFKLSPQHTTNATPKFREDMKRTIGYNWDNTLTYEKMFGDHSIVAMLGANQQDNWHFYLEGTAEGFLTSPKLDPYLSNVTTQTRDTSLGEFGKDDGRRSIFGRLSYNYKEKYMFTGSLRRDGSSRFGKNNRYGLFPSISVGWKVTGENFMEGVTAIDFLKLRVSWGQNGKEPYDKYVYLATVSAENRFYPFEPSLVGVSPDIMPNPDLKWEATTQTNIGFDSRFLKNFSFTFDWYKKTSKDWIIQQPVAGPTGIAGINETQYPYINGGNIENKGIEMELGYNKNFGDLMVSIKANFAYNKNEVTSTEGDEIVGSGSVLYNGSPSFYGVKEGYPIGYFYGYKTGGIFQDSAEIAQYGYTSPESGIFYPYQPNAKAGDVKRLNVNNDSVIDDNDKVMLGDPNPDYIYGFTVSLAYRGFDFAMNIAGQAGNQIVRCYRDETRAYNSYTTEVLDRWTGPGTSNRTPRVTGGTDMNNNWRDFSDLYVEDAGYLKIKSINLGYDFKSLFKTLPVEQLRIYFSATNLWTLTKYKGLDPEVGYGSYYDGAGKLRDQYASGIDLGFYPSARTYLFGINVTF
jgi:TonB-dependent starch-binding outer membrane protein SusC